MKHLFVIGVITVLLAGLLTAPEVNQPAEKVQSAKTKPLSSDSIITAFTFLLGALTVMATLFGVFIGYMGWKSGKEYEKEVVRAEGAASRAQIAAKEAEAAVIEIRSKGEKAIKDIGGKLQKVFDGRSLYRVDETGKVEQNLKAVLEKTNKLYKFIGNRQTREKLTELRSKTISILEKGRPKQAAGYLEQMIALDEDDAVIWHALSLILLALERYDEALEKISTSIKKDPKRASAYFTRINALLSWHKKGGPKPSKDSIIGDIRMANKLGYKSDYEDRVQLADFLNDDEYEGLTGYRKEEDRAISDKKLVICEKIGRILDRAIAKLKEGDNQAALGLIEAATIFFEENASLWVAWGIVLSELERYEEGLQKIEVAIKQDLRDGSAYFNRASVKLKWHRVSGPKPTKEEIVEDIKLAAKHGRLPAKYDEEDKVLLSHFLGKAEYDRLISSLKEESA